MSTTHSPDCPRARRAIHRRLDGERMGPKLRARLEAHLAECAGCREVDSELRAIQQGLARLPVERMPDIALRQVLERTVRSPRAGARHRWGLDWRLAAAAMVTVAVIGFWSKLYPPPQQPSDAELRQAAVEARAVLALTAQALRKAERAATHDVLAGQLSPALRRVPIDWPEPSGPAEGRQTR